MTNYIVFQLPAKYCYQKTDLDNAKFLPTRIQKRTSIRSNNSLLIRVSQQTLLNFHDILYPIITGRTLAKNALMATNSVSLIVNHDLLYMMTTHALTKGKVFTTTKFADNNGEVGLAKHVDDAPDLDDIVNEAMDAVEDNLIRVHPREFYNINEVLWNASYHLSQWKACHDSHTGGFWSNSEQNLGKERKEIGTKVCLISEEWSDQAVLTEYIDYNTHPDNFMTILKASLGFLTQEHKLVTQLFEFLFNLYGLPKRSNMNKYRACFQKVLFRRNNSIIQERLAASSIDELVGVLSKYGSKNMLLSHIDSFRK